LLQLNNNIFTRRLDAYTDKDQDIMIMIFVLNYKKPEVVLKYLDITM